MRKVVVTGMGVISPLGNDTETTWLNLQKGRSGISTLTISGMKSESMPGRIAGALKGFAPEDFLPVKDILRLDPFAQYAAAASLMATEDAGIMRESLARSRAGILIGSSRGGIMSMEKALEKHLLEQRTFSPYLMSSSTINMAASYVSMRLKIRGPALGISAACASGTCAIGEATRLIKSGVLDVVVAGGTEAPICRLTLGGYGSAGALSKRNEEPERASRPFERDRDGFVLSEGAGIFLLEEYGHALRRGARIYAEISGYGTSSDAFHQTKPDCDGEAIAIRRALEDAGAPGGEVNYINAHATSTVLGDRVEVMALEKVFGKRIYQIPVSSSKSMLGHMLGAAGAVEAAVTALSIYHGTIVPTINLEHPDRDCNLHHVTSVTRQEVDVAVTNSFGFGGINAVLVLRKSED